MLRQAKELCSTKMVEGRKETIREEKGEGGERREKEEEGGEEVRMDGGEGSGWRKETEES